MKHALVVIIYLFAVVSVGNVIVNGQQQIMDKLNDPIYQHCVAREEEKTHEK